MTDMIFLLIHSCSEEGVFKLVVVLWEGDRLTWRVVFEPLKTGQSRSET